MGDRNPIQNPDQQQNSTGVAAQAPDHPAGRRPRQGKLRSCMRRSLAVPARSRKRVHIESALSPPPKRARCEAPPDGSLHELAAASAAAAAQEAAPLLDEGAGNAPAERASAERRRESEEAHRLKCQSEARNARLMCEEGGGGLWEGADMPQAQQGFSGSSSDLPAALDTGHGVGWAAADGHPAASTLGSLHAQQSASAGLLGTDLPEPEAGVGMEIEYPSEPDAMLSGSVVSDIYDLE